jgi:hypothetical protein
MSITHSLTHWYPLIAVKYGDINELLEGTWRGKIQGLHCGLHGNCFFGWCLAIKLAINDDYLGDRDGTSAPGPEPLANLWLLSWWFVFHFSGTFSYLLDLMIHTEYFFRGSEATHQWTMVGTYVHANFNPIPTPSGEISWGWITIKHQFLHDFSIIFRVVFQSWWL